MGKKAKNATFISGTDAGKISKEIAKVEKRRIVKSTLCNERSSRSHCIVCTYNLCLQRIISYKILQLITDCFFYVDYT